jgi:hypothetical protein
MKFCNTSATWTLLWRHVDFCTLTAFCISQHRVQHRLSSDKKNDALTWVLCTYLYVVLARHQCVHLLGIYPLVWQIVGSCWVWNACFYNTFHRLQEVRHSFIEVFLSILSSLHYAVYIFGIHKQLHSQYSCLPTHLTFRLS